MLANSITTPSHGGFDSLNLIQPIRRAVREKKYERPTPIQIQAIPHLLDGRDLLGCAQTGTGKTGAFALPILQRLNEKGKATAPKGVSALILTPTRELAQQISESFRGYGQFLNIKQTVVYGGVKYNPQIRALSKGVDVLVATPGRLLDLYNQGYVRLDQVETFVLDEADRMLDMGFLPDIRKFLSAMPASRQSMLFSATLPSEIVKLTKSFLNDPIRISVTPPSSTVEKIDQRVMFVDREHKGALLQSVLECETLQRVLVFARTKHGANRLVKNLRKVRVPAEALHGNKTQAARQEALNKFRSGKARVLIATDIASRGLDVDGVTHVINYELPHEPESYVHRIGRTARAGASGVAISFCDAGERGYLANIEKTTNRTVTPVLDHPFHSPSVAEKGKNRFAGKTQGVNKASNPKFAPSPSRKPKKTAHRKGQPTGKAGWRNKKSAGRSRKSR